ncbi:hypothetical protein [Sphingobacterium sp. MYb382]|uniref:hypothetical protein n=1 Tax=Sphingobacterium sp. MYb382 TaxID=2745278 RepID=UPI0030B038A1
MRNILLSTLLLFLLSGCLKDKAPDYINPPPELLSFGLVWKEIEKKENNGAWTKIDTGNVVVFAVRNFPSLSNGLFGEYFYEKIAVNTPLKIAKSGSFIIKDSIIIFRQLSNTQATDYRAEVPFSLDKDEQELIMYYTQEGLGVKVKYQRVKK